MTWRKPQFDHRDVEVLDEQPLFQGFYQMVKYRLRHKLFAGGWGEPIERELFKRGCSVAVLVFDPDTREVGLIEQFRIGALQEESGPWLLEVVAGMVDKAETPEQVALRELQEEAGVAAQQLLPICNYLSSPGGSSEKLHLFLALVDLHNHSGGVFGLDDEGEDIRFHRLSLEDAVQAVQAGRCKDAATVICLQWLQLNLDKVLGGSLVATG